MYYTESEDTPIYDGFSLTIERGESVVVIGSSGCGKSTLLFLLAGLLVPVAGEILIEGRPITKPRPQTAFILQEYGLFPWLTVEENVGLGLRVRGIPRAERLRRIEEQIRNMDIAEVKRRYPFQLSGGQRQRVALARALSLQPDLLLMDEPLSALDALTRERMQKLLLRIWRKADLTSILVTHSIEEAVYLGTRILVLGGKPACILGEVENPEVGSRHYRSSARFYERCNVIRALLEGGDGDA
jgi:NitT/TauT family transport system ATP-binding protein